jgi:hypothetical protein
MQTKRSVKRSHQYSKTKTDQKLTVIKFRNFRLYDLYLSDILLEIRTVAMLAIFNIWNISYRIWSTCMTCPYKNFLYLANWAYRFRSVAMSDILQKYDRSKSCRL